MDNDNLSNMNPEELINLSETNTSDFKHNRSEIYKRAFEKYGELGDEVNKERMRKEVLIFELVAKNNSGQERYTEMMSGTTDKGESWKFPDLEKDFPEDSIDYYKERVEQTKNPILKSRYSDFLWEATKEYKYVLIAIDSYLECSDIYFNQDWHMQLMDSLTRALSLSIKIKNELYIDKTLLKYNKYIEELVDLNSFRWTHELIELILDSERQLRGKVNLNDYISVIETAIKYYNENENDSFHIQQEFLGLLIKVYRCIGNETQALNTKKRIAETFIEEAEWKKINYPNGNMVAAHFYELALQEYTELGGFSEKVDELKKKVTECNKTAREKEYKVISGKIEIPKEAMDNFMARYDVENIEKFIYILRYDPNLIPTWDSCIEFAEESAKKFVFSHFMDKTVMRGNICVKVISEEKDKIEYGAIEHFNRSLGITKLLLNNIFFELKTKFGDYREPLISIISEGEFISEQRIEIIKIGIERFYEQDYVSACHLLVFQIEGILRDMIGFLGRPTFSYRNNEMRERMLSDIVEEIKGIKGFDQDFLKLIEIFLSDIRGSNLRNEIAHGLVEAKVLDYGTALILLLIIIKLLSYHTTRKSRKTSMSKKRKQIIRKLNKAKINRMRMRRRKNR